MRKLETIEGKVKEILNESPESRDDDMMLYLYVCSSCLKNKGIEAGSLHFNTIMTQYRSLGIPCYESVRRARQKLQAKCPELAGNRQIQKLRTVQEKTYRKYVKE